MSTGAETDPLPTFKSFSGSVLGGTDVAPGHASVPALFLLAQRSGNVMGVEDSVYLTPRYYDYLYPGLAAHQKLLPSIVTT